MSRKNKKNGMRSDNYDETWAVRQRKRLTGESKKKRKDRTNGVLKEYAKKYS